MIRILPCHKSRMSIAVAYFVFTNGCTGEPPPSEFHFSIPLSVEEPDIDLEMDDGDEDLVAESYTAATRSGWDGDAPAGPMVGGVHIDSAELLNAEDDGESIQFTFDTTNYTNGYTMMLSPGKYTVDVYKTFQWPGNQVTAHVHSTKFEMLADGTIVDVNGDEIGGEGNDEE